jgi:hypothetical protein
MQTPIHQQPWSAVFIRRVFGVLSQLLICMIAPQTSWAAAYELRVYSDDVPNQGESELEIIASVANPKPSIDGPNARVVQTLVEFGFGLGQGWSVGLELPTSHVQGIHKLEGIKAEAQYVSDHNKAHGGYWGVRSDIGYTTTPYESQGGYSIDVNPILGYRWGKWHAVINPSIETPLNQQNKRSQFLPSAKVARAMSSTQHWGMEYFSSWGAVSSVLPQQQRDETVYIVLNQKFSSSQLNIGLGKPLNPSGASVDRWVLKLGLNFDLN